MRTFDMVNLVVYLRQTFFLVPRTHLPLNLDSDRHERVDERNLYKRILKNMFQQVVDSILSIFPALIIVKRQQ